MVELKILQVCAWIFLRSERAGDGLLSSSVSFATSGVADVPGDVLPLVIITVGEVTPLFFVIITGRFDVIDGASSAAEALICKDLFRLLLIMRCLSTCGSTIVEVTCTRLSCDRRLRGLAMHVVV